MKLITAARESGSEHFVSTVAVLPLLGESAERLSALLRRREFRGKTEQAVFTALAKCYETYGERYGQLPSAASEKPAVPESEGSSKTAVIILVGETAGRMYTVSEKPEFKGRTENEIFMSLATCYERYKANERAELLGLLHGAGV